MDYSKMISLIKNLKQKTENKIILWTETEDEGIYQTAFPNFTVRLSKITSLDPKNQSEDYWIGIYNLEGRLIEKLSNKEIFSGYTIYDSERTLMKDLYALAHRCAMGVDDALDEIINELGPLEEDDKL